MQSIFTSKKTFVVRFALCCAAVVGLLSFANATENGASVYPVGVETVLTGLAPHPGETMFYEYTAFVAANETDGPTGQKVPIDFKLRVFANAFKMSHTWNMKFLGGNLDSEFVVPFVYQQLHVPPGKFEQFAIGNAALFPVGINWHSGIAHWLLDSQFFLPGTGYAKGQVLNIGQHNLAYGPAFSMTLLPNHGKTEISSRTTYIINGYDKDTSYHGGNEFMDEFAGMQQVSSKIALGVAGFIYQQTTDDHQFGLLVNGDGYKGRDLAIGPQFRYNWKHGGFAVKYFRDTLVENKVRGGTLWFQMAVPFNGFTKPAAH